jgi:hypothetical protein
MKNFEVEIIDGFTSEQTCLNAAKEIKIGSQASNHLAIQGLLNSKIDHPAVFADCVKIEK